MSKIIVIVGPTGVGKTKLSIALAKEFNGEIINGDSMQIYKGLDIGTAKIKETEKAGIPHHLFDIKDVNEHYSVFDYQQDGRTKIDEIKAQNKVPIIVGGTGLYIKALLYDYRFGVNNTLGDNLLYDCIFIGLTMPRDELYQIINNRVDKMIADGLIDEVASLYKQNIRSKAIKTGIGYKELYQYFDNIITLEEAINLIKKHSRNYAKRQYTWFNNKMKIKWFNVDLNNFDKTVKEIINYIKKEHFS